MGVRNLQLTYISSIKCKLIQGHHNFNLPVI